MKSHLDDDIPDEISKAPTLEYLQVLAEEEFINIYDSFPTCAVFAPGSLTLGDKTTDLVQSKSLSMVCANPPTLFAIFRGGLRIPHFLVSRSLNPVVSTIVAYENAEPRATTYTFVFVYHSLEIKQAIQLVTLIVGKRSHGSRWCHVKTLVDEIDGEKTARFCLNEENLEISMDEASWIRYLKATIQCFKAKQGSFIIPVIS